MDNQRPSAAEARRWAPGRSAFDYGKNFPSDSEPIYGVSPDELQRFRQRLESDMRTHGEWASAVYRALVFPVFGRGPSPCVFDHNRWRAPAAFFALKEIEECHRACHDAAQAMYQRLGRGGSAFDPSDLEAFQLAEAKLAEAARQGLVDLSVAEYLFDPVTNLPSRHALPRVLQREYNRMIRTGHVCSMALGDLDDFKSLNDQYGHPAGDVILREAARSFSSGLRPYDSVFRYGGDEFLFCLPDAPASKARRILERLRAGLEQCRLSIHGVGPIRLTASFGVAELRESRDIQQTIQTADKCLYEAKRLGRNRIRVPN